MTERIADVVTNAGRIDWRTFKKGDQFVMALADTGVGIAPDLLRKIFEPFHDDTRGAMEWLLRCWGHQMPRARSRRVSSATP